MKRAPAILVLVALAACGRGPGAVDLLPRSGWTAGPGVAVREDGRISLTGDGRGYVWKAVTLDVDRYPVVLVRTAQTLPRLTWSLAVEKSDAAIASAYRAPTLLEKHAEEGAFIVRLRDLTGWRGKTRFALILRLDGLARDWIEMADLKAVHLTDDPPPAPRLLLPASGGTVASAALHYEWRQAPNAVSYDLQVSPSRASFPDTAVVRVLAPYLADKLPYLPTDAQLLPPGTWWWRVRGLNATGRAGPWSAPGSVTIVPLRPRRPRELEISPRHPLFLFVADGRRLAAQWRAVPQDLKPFTLLRVEVLPSESLEAALDVAQREGIPVAFQASGPHDFYGPVSSRIPLTEVERIFERYPVVRAVYICEQNFRVAPLANRIMMDYVRRLIPLAAAYGRTVLWADAHWGRNLWIDVGLDRALMDTIRAFHQYLVPIQKMNGALTPYAAHDAVFGLWVSGAVDGWGVQPERWYWYEAGLGAPGRYGWFKEGDMAAFPPPFYAQMGLLGLSGGATVYSFEPGDDVFAPGGTASSVARDAIFPLLSAMVSHGLIPAREEALREIRSAYLADSADAPWSLDYGSLRTLYQGSYGIAHPFDLIPRTGRYYWIPILPRWTPPGVLARFPDLLRAALRDSAEARRHLDGRYPAVALGTARVVRVGALTIIQNGDENGGTTQSFEFSLPGASARLSGRVGPHGYLVVQRGAAVLSHNVVLDRSSR